jgi:hypothetical protein
MSRVCRYMLTYVASHFLLREAKTIGQYQVDFRLALMNFAHATCTAGP